MTYKIPLVSVVIPTYKRPVSLPRAIKSVLNSSYRNIEIIVVDDNNEGDEYRIETERIMLGFLESNSNIKYLKHSVNRNGSAARNTGIRQSSGEYLMFLDDDDEFLENKIEQQVRCLESKDDSWGACYTKYVDVQNEKVVSKCAESQEGNMLINELARNFFVHAGSNLMIRRKVVLEVNGFDETFLRNQDVEFLVRILKKYKIAYVDVDGLKVYIRPRKYAISYYDLTDHYLNKFRYEIEKLAVDDQNAIYKMIGLQLIRHSLEEGNLSRLINYKKQYKLSWIIIFEYLLYLCYRKVIKKSYGFNINRLYERSNKK